ncbi:hypothetical protein RhiirA1_393644 [Rhizophagus irregularis]|uniref:Uncharacterized protein n=1 Tax=Rhizophagus irregularis TaxID=588596 RepID=A0A2N0RW69_9GLOM|nr:hypothetical protein RhiirA1_393644 [Rhizophagus irregularis]
MTPYEIVLQDLLTEGNSFHELQDESYSDEMDDKTKIHVTYRCLLRAQRLKQRIPVLVFAYFLGQLIEQKELTKKQVRQIVSEYYYWISVRVYYIFETNPIQIYCTVNTTVNLIRSLRQNEIKQLVLEI